MNALIGVRSNAAGLLNPTPKQRLQAAEEVTANYRANIIGRLRAAGVLEQFLPAEADPVTAAKAAAAQPKQTGAIAGAMNNDLNRDAFLLLLMEQIRHQDPLDPMDNSAMVAQLAQFSALEQMNNLNAGVQALGDALGRSLSFMTASSMIGRTVSWTDGEGLLQQGRVNAVSMMSGVPYLRVDDFIVPVEAVGLVEA